MIRCFVCRDEVHKPGWCDACHVALRAHQDGVRERSPTKALLRDPKRADRLKVYMERAEQALPLFA